MEKYPGLSEVMLIVTSISFGLLSSNCQEELMMAVFVDFENWMVLLTVLFPWSGKNEAQFLRCSLARAAGYPAMFLQYIYTTNREMPALLFLMY